MVELEQEFEREMLDTCDIASRAGYTPTRFRQMIQKNGGVAAAKSLLTPGPIHEGFSKLWERRLLDISVEYKCLNPKWRTLFDPQELRVAQERLDQLEHAIPTDWRVQP